ncbi:MAG: hypothetical protein ACRDG4_01185 [Chloroflexota bacterium]
MSRSRGLWVAASTSPDTIAAGDVFEAMLDGWRDQQLARSLNEVTIDARERVVRRFPRARPDLALGVAARTRKSSLQRLSLSGLKTLWIMDTVDDSLTIAPRLDPKCRHPARGGFRDPCSGGSAIRGLGGAAFRPSGQPVPMRAANSVTSPVMGTRT